MHRFGVFCETSLIISRSSSTLASLAIAKRCSTVLEEQPSAISQASPLRNDFSFTISLGRISFSTISITAIPAFFASWIRAEYTAGIVPLPGNAIPSTSHRQFMELAVNIPEQEPQPGQAFCSICVSSA